ncbi:MAG: MFS transporter [Alicyclobacillus sp.]|nr:MFS transporter [Alicyclobacillus sp.]
MKKHISLAAFWFSLSFQQAALLTIAIPAAVDRLTRSGHIVLLAQLTTLGDLLMMAAMPLVGALSDRIRMRGGTRRSVMVAGAAANGVGLVVGGSAHNVLLFAGGFLLAMLGLSAAGATFQALMPELVSPSEWGKGSGYMGVAMLLGNAIGLALTGFLPLWAAFAAMIAVTAGGALYTWFGVAEPAVARPIRRPVARQAAKPTAFYFVFAARFLVMFGQTLLMTYVLYDFSDVLHVARPTELTAELSLLALVGAAFASLGVGALSDRVNRAKIVAAATLPMAGATIAFGFTHTPAGMLCFAVVYGAGYGAFLSVDWALALDTMPSLDHVARNLSLWGLAAALPSVIAPAVGGLILHQPGSLEVSYQHLYWLAGTAIFAGAVVVWFAADDPGDSRWSTVLSLAVAAVLTFAVTLRCSARLYGRLPKTGSVLVVSNHVHDFDGAFIPPRLYLRGRWRHPVYTVASQRLFEAGFLAVRSPRWLSRWLRGFNAGPILRLIGVRPIEDSPRRQPLFSWAGKIRRLVGDARLADVLHAEVLEDAGVAAADLRLSDLYRPQWLYLARKTVALRAIAEPLRGELRASIAPRVTAQIDAICDLLARGRTVYVTPEGRLTADGRIGPFHAVLDPLAATADRLFLSAVSYDPFRPGRIGIECRIVPYTGGVDMPTALAAARPIHASHALVAALHDQGGDVLLSDVVRSAELALAALPSAANLATDLRRDRRRALVRTVRRLVERGYLQPCAPAVDEMNLEGTGSGVRYRVHTPWRDRRFAHVADLFPWLHNQWLETREALEKLDRVDDITFVHVN